MKKTMAEGARIVFLALIMAFGLAASVMGSENDNSLYSLGINTEGVTVEPEFSYDIWEYTVTVPGGTTRLSLDPVPSSTAASIADISGADLDEDGSGTVRITVEAGNGDQWTYTLNVVSGGEAAPAQTEAETQPPTEKQTEPQTEKKAAQTEPETEDKDYVTVPRNTIQEAENTITDLKKEIAGYKDTIRLYTYLMYGLIAFAVIMLFIVINQIIRKKDLKEELADYRSLGYSNSKTAQKARKKAEKEQQKKARAQEKAGASGKAPAQENTRQGAGETGTPARIPAAGPGAGYRSAGDGLDVQPQVSAARRQRQMPQYEGGNAAGAGADRSAGGAGAGSQAGPTGAAADRSAGGAGSAGSTTSQNAGGDGASGAASPAGANGAAAPSNRDHAPANGPGAAGAGNAPGPQEAGSGADAGGKGPRRRGKAGKDIEINMIDL